MKLESVAACQTGKRKRHSRRIRSLMSLPGNFLDTRGRSSRGRSRPRSTKEVRNPSAKDRFRLSLLGSDYRSYVFIRSDVCCSIPTYSQSPSLSLSYAGLNTTRSYERFARAPPPSGTSPTNASSMPDPGSFMDHHGVRTRSDRSRDGDAARAAAPQGRAGLTAHPSFVGFGVAVGGRSARVGELAGAARSAGREGGNGALTHVGFR